MSIILSLQKSFPDSGYYIGAVVEYRPVKNEVNPEENIKLNVKNYRKFIEKSAEKVIVFDYKLHYNNLN